ncbi:hypothetical protein ASPBRDRAFT_138890, partial [Aspergillus brasiliensis CBS 101740]
GCQVQLAIHKVSAYFVQGCGFGLYPAEGDRTELMAYMIKDPHLISIVRLVQQQAIYSAKFQCSGRC